MTAPADTGAHTGVDPVTFEVVRGNLGAICEEMKAVIQRASFSPLLSLSADLSCALADAAGQVVAQGNDIPVHLGAMPLGIAGMLAAYPPEGWRPGDAVLMNDPYRGGNHLPDMTLMTPVFADATLIGFAVSRVHWPDVGGPVPGSSSVSDHILKEGLRVPPIRIARDDVLDAQLVDLIVSNMRMRMRSHRLGDLQAQCAGNRRGGERLARLAGRYGAQTLRAVMRATLDHSEAIVSARIATLPEGVWRHAESLDGDGYTTGGDMTIRAAVSRRGDRLRFDFSGSSPCTRGPMNAPPSVTASAAYYVTLAVFGEGAAPNAGAYRPVDVVTQPGTLVHAVEPFPVVAANTETATRIVDVLLGALAQAGDFAVAGSYGCAAVYTLGGTQPDTGRPFVHYETVGGGGGAGPRADGLDGLRVHMGNTMNLPIEALEARLPVAFEGYALVPDSGGAGAHRGGEGVRKRFRVLADGVDFSMLLERTQSAAAGYRGGGAGAVASVVVERADGRRETLPSKAHVVLGRGDVVDIVTAGGGGWGVPGTAPAATSSSCGPTSPSAPDR